MATNNLAWKAHAIEVLKRALNGTLNSKKEWVLDLGRSVQISWIDEDDPTKSVVVNIYSDDMHPFQIES
jgi:hypothetical protein